MTLSTLTMNKQLLEKWAPMLDHKDLPKIGDMYRRAATAQILENAENDVRTQGQFAPASLFEVAPTNQTAQVQYQDPVLITMLRRSMPNLMAYDVAGVQPMSGPTGLIFAMRALYTSNSGNEAFYDEPDSSFSTVVGNANTLGDKHTGTVPGNTTTGTANLAETGIYNYGDAMATLQAEALGSSGNVAWPEMAFTIDKLSVTAGSRALKAQYSLELAQDLRAVHGMDAEKELANILSTEIIAEINRELIRTINVTAKRGAASGTTTAGRFDLDTDAGGRWLGEKFKGLVFFMDIEANQIAKETRRGKGNIVICSSNVASALQMAGALDYTPAINNDGLTVDDTGNTFAGIANKRFRVYIDPYTTGNYMTLGFKGANPMDAGLFYCPYVPLQMMRAVSYETMQPAIGFKTRYAMGQNPFSYGVKNGAVGGMSVTLTKDSNVYYRRIMVDNIL